MGTNGSWHTHSLSTDGKVPLIENYIDTRRSRSGFLEGNVKGIYDLFSPRSALQIGCGGLIYEKLLLLVSKHVFRDCSCKNPVLISWPSHHDFCRCWLLLWGCTSGPCWHIRSQWCMMLIHSRVSKTFLQLLFKHIRVWNSRFSCLKCLHVFISISCIV